MKRVTLGKSRVRDIRPPGSVRVKAKWLSYPTTIHGVNICSLFNALMGGHSANRKSDFVDRGDWPGAIACFIFLIIFPIVIIAGWNAPRDKAPLHFLVPFSLVFALAVPFLVGGVLGARTRRIAIDAPGRALVLTTVQPFNGAQSRSIAMEDVRRVLFKTADSDGGFSYRGLLDLGAADQIVFTQGNHHVAVRAEAERMITALRQVQPALEIVETRG
jgi:hypothetical protein